MIQLTFTRADLDGSNDSVNEKCTLTVADGHVELVGDDDCIDYDFIGFSPRSSSPVTYKSDPEEWARTLPLQYSGGDLVVEALDDTEPWTDDELDTS